MSVKQYHVFVAYNMLTGNKLIGSGHVNQTWSLDTETTTRMDAFDMVVKQISKTINEDNPMDIKISPTNFTLAASELP